jgi:predicted membrane metal-binding protein
MDRADHTALTNQSSLSPETVDQTVSPVSQSFHDASVLCTLATCGSAPLVLISSFHSTSDFKTSNSPLLCSRFLYVQHICTTNLALCHSHSFTLTFSYSNTTTFSIRTTNNLYTKPQK